MTVEIIFASDAGTEVDRFNPADLAMNHLKVIERLAEGIRRGLALDAEEPIR